MKKKRIAAVALAFAMTAGIGMNFYSDFSTGMNSSYIITADAATMTDGITKPMKNGQFRIDKEIISELITKAYEMPGVSGDISKFKQYNPNSSGIYGVSVFKAGDEGNFINDAPTTVEGEFVGGKFVCNSDIVISDDSLIKNPMTVYRIRVSEHLDSKIVNGEGYISANFIWDAESGWQYVNEVINVGKAEPTLVYTSMSRDIETGGFAAKALSVINAKRCVSAEKNESGNYSVIEKYGCSFLKGDTSYVVSYPNIDHEAGITPFKQSFPTADDALFKWAAVTENNKIWCDEMLCGPYVVSLTANIGGVQIPSADAESQSAVLVDAQMNVSRVKTPADEGLMPVSYWATNETIMNTDILTAYYYGQAVDSVKVFSNNLPIMSISGPEFVSGDMNVVNSNIINTHNNGGKNMYTMKVIMKDGSCAAYELTSEYEWKLTDVTGDGAANVKPGTTYIKGSSGKFKPFKTPLEDAVQESIDDARYPTVIKNMNGQVVSETGVLINKFETPEDMDSLKEDFKMTDEEIADVLKKTGGLMEITVSDEEHNNIINFIAQSTPTEEDAGHIDAYIYTGIKGDVNQDGQFNVADVIMFQRYLLGMYDSENTAAISEEDAEQPVKEVFTLANWLAGDVTNDGTDNVFDMCMLKHMLIEKINKPVEEEPETPEETDEPEDDTVIVL